VTADPRLREYERRFRRAGLPLWIEGYSASRDVFNRAVPLLALVFFGEVVGATSLDWSLGANIAAALGGLAILFAAGAVVNRTRGRPALALPEEVGRVELAAFVVLPAILPLAFGGQWRSALVRGRECRAPRPDLCGGGLRHPVEPAAALGSRRRSLLGKPRGAQRPEKMSPWAPTSITSPLPSSRRRRARSLGCAPR
jgi:hypothetical protein